MNQEQTPKKITVALEHVELDYDRESLGELLAKALEVINRPVPRAEIWLSRWAIRAVCNAIIASGEAAFPLEVELRKPRAGFWKQPMSEPDDKASAVEMEQIEISVPGVFLRLCEEYYRINPTRIAEALVYSFTQNPPRELELLRRGQPGLRW